MTQDILILLLNWLAILRNRNIGNLDLVIQEKWKLGYNWECPKVCVNLQTDVR